MRFTYCPHCGTRAIQKEIGDEGLIPYCDRCQVPLWDMFTTAIIAAVVNECGEVALLRQNYISQEYHICLSGIMKLGESAEETAIREIQEEIGLTVKRLEYIRSWPMDNKDMLMLGFKAVADKADFTLSQEVDSVQWVKYADALALMRPGSIAWQLVKTVIEE